MGDMSSESINRPGAVDLSDLARAAQNSAPQTGPVGAGGPQGSATAGRTWVVKGTEENFNSLVQKSLQHPVLVEFTSSRAHGADQTSALLDRITDEAAGKWLLVRVDVDSEQRLAQTIGVQAVPMLVAVIGGQLAPLAHGTLDEQQIRQITEQVSEAAVASGMVARAEPVASTDYADSEPVGPDPRTVEAEKLVDEGRFDKAVAAYDELLASAPNDPVLVAGRNGAAILGRVSGKDPAGLLATAQAHPDDVAAQLAAADVELLGGSTDAAFDRLLNVVRTTTDEDRETARARLLELFAMVGQSDPSVARARRRLAAALF